jgi:hypothetical protein
MKFITAVVLMLSMTVSVFAEEKSETNQNPAVHKEYKTIVLPCGRTTTVAMLENSNPSAASTGSVKSIKNLGER